MVGEDDSNMQMDFGITVDD